MAERDMIEKYGEDAVRKMEFEERINKEQPFLDMYGKEFEENGLKKSEAKKRTVYYSLRDINFDYDNLRPL